MNNGEKLHDLLKQSVQLYSDQIALICNEEKITYKRLFELSLDLQDSLKTIGIEKGSRVAIYSEKSITFVASIFGILNSNCAYIPIDASAPIERNKFIITDCDVSALIIQKKYIDFFENEFDILVQFEDLILLKNKNRNQKKSPEDLAYILYTSGSTGNPKGVMYSHSGAMSFVNWCNSTFKLKQSDCFSSHAPFHFDLSIFDIFVCVKNASSLVIITENIARQPMLLAKQISDLKISVWYSTPTILNLISEYGKIEKYDFSHLKLILFAGEVYPLKQFLKLYNKLPLVSYYNLYGPTESNVCCYFKLENPKLLIENIPIGKACAHYESKIIESKTEGELLISGKALMIGYWNMESLTNEKILIDDNGLKWYKTGDIVALDSNNDYVFKGRVDRMIKRNGYRIELDEIEKTLLKCEGIQYCAVISTQSKQNTMQIVSYIVTENKNFKSIIEMKSISMKLLPIYMIPDDFIFVNSLPITSSNKIDYQKLIKQTV